MGCYVGGEEDLCNKGGPVAVSNGRMPINLPSPTRL